MAKQLTIILLYQNKVHRKEQSQETIFAYLHSFSGLCLLLYNNSRINYYKCNNFLDGCPDNFYFSDTVYKCKLFFSVFYSSFVFNCDGYMGALNLTFVIAKSFYRPPLFWNWEWMLPGWIILCQVKEIMFLKLNLYTFKAYTSVFVVFSGIRYLVGISLYNLLTCL